MGTLVFVCPTSGREVFTGLEIDPASFQGLPKVLAEIKCADCGGTHNLFEVELRLADDGSTPPGDELASPIVPQKQRPLSSPLQATWFDVLCPGFLPSLQIQSRS